MIRVYNTMERNKVDFQPVREGQVSMYVCGPTTYNFIHIGNARPMVVFDAIRKYLGYRGYQVTYIQNFTDIDDKIIRKANEEKVEPLELAGRYIREYEKDALALGVKPADIHPRVSENMDEIILMVKTLVEKGHAYELDGDVYFDVRSFGEYGKLSGRDLDDLKSGARVQVDEKKKDPLDFALWKKAKPGEPSWESPWGQGRPGWHIECSAMSMKYMGPTFDIHGGGFDLIFPHHENEIAQSECYTGEMFAKYWLHNGFITVNEEKMSKSLGNFFLVREVLEKFPGAVIRFFLLSTHYRSPLDFSDTKLAEDAKALARLQNTWNRLQEAVPAGEEESLAQMSRDTRNRIEEAMDDDFNTALAVAELFAFSREINSALARGMSEKELLLARKVLKDFAIDILGIVQEDATAVAEDSGLTARLMELIIEIRTTARSEKNWPLADRIRDRLKEAGILLEDTPEGPRWKVQ